MFSSLQKEVREDGMLIFKENCDKKRRFIKSRTTTKNKPLNPDFQPDGHNI